MVTKSKMNGNFNMGAASGLLAQAQQLRGKIPIPSRLRNLIPVYLVVMVFFLITMNRSLFTTTDISSLDTTPGVTVTGPPSHKFTPKPFDMTKLPPVLKPRTDFPQKIWQTWKIHPFAFEQRDSERARSWVEKNPGWRYEVLTDGNELPYVEYHFGPEGFNRPDIVDFYRTVKATIVKADLLRYMIMYAEGGIYADIDVQALKSMDKFVPPRYNHKDVDMVIGVEIDEPDWKNHPILGQKSMSFCQWTFMCKPQLPVMMRLIEQIMDWLSGVAKRQGVSIADVDLDFDEIIVGTGPSAFTSAILADMNARKTGGKTIDWDMFHDLQESRVVSRILVLTVEAFAAGQGHSDSGNHDARAALVRHHYHASNWPSRHPRFKHPVYGEVENCNWKDDCINEWDANTAAFTKLSKEEQQKLIAEAERKAQEEKEKKEAEEKKKQEEDEQRRKEEEDRKRKEEEERREREEQERKEQPGQ